MENQMKKLALALAVLTALASPAAAASKKRVASPPQAPANLFTCGFFFIPANCSPADRIIGGAIVGGALGFGVGAIVGASGGVITGGALAASGTGGVAGSYAVIGATVGATGGLLVAR
jgi:hypothetical protein